MVNPLSDSKFGKQVLLTLESPNKENIEPNLAIYQLKISQIEPNSSKFFNSLGNPRFRSACNSEPN